VRRLDAETTSQPRNGSSARPHPAASRGRQPPVIGDLLGIHKKRAAVALTGYSRLCHGRLIAAATSRAAAIAIYWLPGWSLPPEARPSAHTPARAGPVAPACASPRASDCATARPLRRSLPRGAPRRNFGHQAPLRISPADSTQRSAPGIRPDLLRGRQESASEPRHRRRRHAVRPSGHPGEQRTVLPGEPAETSPQRGKPHAVQAAAGPRTSSDRTPVRTFAAVALRYFAAVRWSNAGSSCSNYAFDLGSYGDSNRRPLACHPLAANPPVPVHAGQGPGGSSIVRLRPGRLLYSAAVPLP